MSKFLDCTGRPIKVGQAIAHGHTARGGGLHLYEVGGFTAKRVKAAEITYYREGDPKDWATNLQNYDQAYILSETPGEVKARMIPYEAKRSLEKTCPNCGGGLSIQLDGIQPIAVGCSGPRSCGAMYDLNTKVD
jgi:hypothetical protein